MNKWRCYLLISLPSSFHVSCHENWELYPRTSRYWIPTYIVWLCFSIFVVSLAITQSSTCTMLASPAASRSGSTNRPPSTRGDDGDDEQQAQQQQQQQPLRVEEDEEETARAAAAVSVMGGGDGSRRQRAPPPMPLFRETLWEMVVKHRRLRLWMREESWWGCAFMNFCRISKLHMSCVLSTTYRVCQHVPSELVPSFSDTHVLTS